MKKLMFTCSLQKLPFVLGGALCLVAGTQSVTYAGGFQFNEHSARATGRANSVVATVNDPSSIYHNPAGITATEGTEFMVGANTIFANVGYAGPGLPGNGGPTDGQSLNAAPSIVPHVFASHKFSDKFYAGLGFYLPYGSSAEWEDPDNFVGRTGSRTIALRTYYFTPTAGFKLNENISVAVGLSLIPATLLIERDIGNDAQEPLFQPGGAGLLELSASAFGVGATAGVQVKFLENFKAGLAYRSAIDLNFEGDVNFTLPEGTPNGIASNFPDQTGNGDLTLPHTFSLGLGWEIPSFTIEAGAQFTMWESYDELGVNLDAGLPAPTSVSARDWENVFIFRLGGEYRIDALALRAGAAIDFAPAPDSTLEFSIPANDRVLLSLGAGYDFGAVRVDASYLGSYAIEREFGPNVSVNIPAGGTFTDGLSSVIALSLGFKI